MRPRRRNDSALHEHTQHRGPVRVSSWHELARLVPALPSPGWIAARLGVAACLALGCGDDAEAKPETPAEASSEPEAASEDPAAFTIDAHRKAFREALPKAEAALALADPIAADAAADHALRPTPVRAARLAELEAAIKDASSALADIQSRHLQPEEAVILQVTRFGIDRHRDTALRTKPWTHDPEWIVLETARLFDAIDRHLDAGKDVAEAAEALRQLPAELEAASAGLVAASLPVLAAAVTDTTQLLARLEGMTPVEGTPGWHEARDQAHAALSTLATTLERQRAQLVRKRTKRGKRSGKRRKKTGKNADANETAPVTALKRLPNRLDNDQLRRRLEVEEHLGAPVRKLFDEVGYALDRLQTAKYKAPKRLRSRRQPVTLERCRAAWDELQTWAARQPALKHAALDCAHMTPRLAALGPLDDTDLTLALIDRGIVAPTQRARRREEADVLALVHGHAAPYSHRRALQIAVLSGMRHSALRRAIDHAQAELCLSAAALWVHGHLGADAALKPRFEDRCESRKLAEWIELAQARPRASLAGLGIVHLGLGLAQAVALDRYWWAPLGLIETLAVPAEPPTTPPQESLGPSVVVESLDP